ncbi:MAG TPA: YdbH domain-containing protein [Alphaproteobacteria bacterium]|nr:YdbH domain-containing protein [Alphaproteobacteria bacterium]
MVRRRSLILFGTAGALLAAAGWLTLPRAAGHLARGWLAAQGHGPAALTVADIGWSGAVLTGLRLAGDRLTADRIDLDYTPAGLLAGRIDGATLHGLQLHGRLDAGGLTLEPFGPLGGEGDGAAAPVGRLTLEGARLALETPAGRIDLLADGTLSLTDGRSGRLDLAASGPLAGRFALELAEGAATLAVQDATVALPGLAAAGVTGRAAFADAALWGEFGAATLDIGGTAFAGAALRLDGTAEAVTARLAGQAAGAALDLALVVADPFAPSPRATLTGTAGLGEGRPALEIDAALIDLRRAEDATTLDLRLGLEAGPGRVTDITLAGATLDLPLHAEWHGGKLWVHLAEPGRLEARGLRRGEALRLAGPARLTLPAGGEPLLIADPAAGGLRLNLAAETGALDGRAGGQAFALPAGRLQVAAGWTGAAGLDGEARWALPRLRLPDLPLAAGPAEAALRLADLRLTAKAEAAVLGTPGLLPPLALAGRLAPDGGRLAFDLTAAAPGLPALAAKGRHDPATGAGSARIDWPVLRFAPGGLQPAALSPRLAAATEASGEAGLSGTLGWGGAATDLRLLLRELSFAVGGARIERLNGLVALDGLFPPSTPPGQSLSAALIDVGVPLTDAVADLSLRRDGTVGLALRRLGLAGGQVTTAPLAFDPARPGLETVLVVSGVELGRALDLGGLEGLAATGTLGGRIPVSLRDGAVRVAGGRLAADGPGTIRYRPARPPAALAGAGEQLSLLLAALEDFRYDSLALTLERDGAGEAALGLHLKGNNPALYGGYPIELNVNLTGALDRIVRDSLSGYRVPDQIRERMATFGSDG